jgi:tryptophanyl-tRNA synthetase
MIKIVLTGDRPTGQLHLGHYVGSLMNRVYLQNQPNIKQYVMIADIQALTDNFDNPSKVTENVLEVTKDYLAVGIDPALTTIFIQSQIPELTELTAYFMNLVTLGRLERNPTVKVEIQQKGYDDSIPAGFFCYPVSQAADITAFNANIVPVGEDQIPLIELTNEIVRRFNRIYQTDCLHEVEYMLGKTARLIGIDGKAKASKSLNNAIFLADSSEEIKRKVFSMFTDPNHLKVSDPGQVEGNVVFSYLDAFHHDKEEVEALKKHYQRGGLGDSAIKGILNNTLQELLMPIREKRLSLEQQKVKEILFEGIEKARLRAQDTIQKVRHAIGIDYNYC